MIGPRTRPSTRASVVGRSERGEPGAGFLSAAEPRSSDASGWPPRRTRTHHAVRVARELLQECLPERVSDQQAAPRWRDLLGGSARPRRGPVGPPPFRSPCPRPREPRSRYQRIPTECQYIWSRRARSPVHFPAVAECRSVGMSPDAMTPRSVGSAWSHPAHRVPRTARPVRTAQDVVVAIIAGSRSEHRDPGGDPRGGARASEGGGARCSNDGAPRVASQQAWAHVEPPIT